MKRAAIYARVSKAYKREGETRVTIEEQLTDCDALCRERGYVIVARYVDKDKYRARGKLVSPSGERKDRPAYRTMIEAARAGEFDVIVSWKEDRLYRGIYAAIPLAEMLDERRGAVTVDLVKETFARSMLEIKAAIGKIELDNIRERTTMGVKARLRAGKANTGQDRYGYRRNGEVIEIVEDEAVWVRRIFAWYNERVPSNSRFGTVSSLSALHISQRMRTQ
jgi:DNA invertase Pin-like site-specific DNA recombinase